MAERSPDAEVLLTGDKGAARVASEDRGLTLRAPAQRTAVSPRSNRLGFVMDPDGCAVDPVQ